MTGHEFREMRRSLGYSQQRLAEIMDVERKTIIRIEKSINVPRIYELALSSFARAEFDDAA